jgi:nucleoside-diphosphate-sugar epimerase
MIYVTGSAGFIGSNVCNWLERDDSDYIGIDDLSFGDIINVKNKSRFFLTDFNNFEAGERFGKDKDILIHCATSNIIYGIDHPVETFNNNGLKTIELFRRFNGRIIYMSTSSVYGNAEKIPTTEEGSIMVYNSYDTSKRIAELYLTLRGNYTTLRLSNVYGNQLPSNPYCGVITKLLYCTFNEIPFKIYGNGESTRDYTYIGDVIEAIQKTVTRGSAFTEINIGTGDETSTLELIRLVSKLTGRKVLTEQVKGRDIDCIDRRCLDVSKAKNLLDWQPSTHIGLGLVKTIEWFKHAKLYSNIQAKVS